MVELWSRWKDPQCTLLYVYQSTRIRYPSILERARPVHIMGCTESPTNLKCRRLPSCSPPACSLPCPTLTRPHSASHHGMGVYEQRKYHLCAMTLWSNSACNKMTVTTTSRMSAFVLRLANFGRNKSSPMQMSGKRKVRDGSSSHLGWPDFERYSRRGSTGGWWHLRREYLYFNPSMKVYRRCAAAGLLMPGLPKKWKDLGGTVAVAGIGDESTTLRSILSVFVILRSSPCRVGYFSSNYCAFVIDPSHIQSHSNANRLPTRPIVVHN